MGLGSYLPAPAGGGQPQHGAHSHRGHAYTVRSFTSATGSGCRTCWRSATGGRLSIQPQPSTRPVERAMWTGDGPYGPVGTAQRGERYSHAGRQQAWGRASATSKAAPWYSWPRREWGGESAAGVWCTWRATGYHAARLWQHPYGKCGWGPMTSTVVQPLPAH